LQNKFLTVSLHVDNKSTIWIYFPKGGILLLVRPYPLLTWREGNNVAPFERCELLIGRKISGGIPRGKMSSQDRLIYRVCHFVPVFFPTHTGNLGRAGRRMRVLERGPTSRPDRCVCQRCFCTRLKMRPRKHVHFVNWVEPEQSNYNVVSKRNTSMEEADRKGYVGSAPSLGREPPGSVAARIFLLSAVYHRFLVF